MLRRQHSRAAIFLLSGTLAFVSVACSSINPFRPTTQSLNPVSTSPVAEKLPPSPQQVAAKVASQPTPMQVSPYERAIDTAESAVTITQSAHSLDDWNLVASRWQQAINWLKAVPASSADYEIAINKISEYQRHLNYAQQQIKSPISTGKPATVVEVPCSATLSTNGVNTAFNPLSDPANSTQTLQAVLLASGKNSTFLALNPKVFSAKIKRRIARTPVIEVTFNGKRTFEMIVDSGASATVITPDMAAKLGVCPDTEVLADTASDKMVKFSAGKLKSIAVQGAVAKNMQVVIANSALNIGLLGQDFFGIYDVWIKQDVVEFHAR